MTKDQGSVGAGLPGDGTLHPGPRTDTSHWINDRRLVTWLTMLTSYQPTLGSGEEGDMQVGKPTCPLKTAGWSSIEHPKLVQDLVHLKYFRSFRSVLYILLHCI